MPTINDDKPDYSFLEVFKNIVDAYRDKDAIVTQGKDRVTYGQLFSKACRTAKLIQAAGIEEGEPVGIGISKSAAYIASMLGTWIAGAAFVPIDPVLPKERAQFIINQAKIRLALVSHDGAASLASLGVRTLPVDNDWSDDGGFAKLAREKIDYVPKRLAYIIYTSGSTGRPKGVMVSHAGIWNFLSQQIEAFQFEPGSRSLFVLSTNFDASVSDIGCALLAGSTLFIEPPGLLAPGPHFMDLLKEREITHMDVPPSLLKTMSCDQAPSSLKTIVIGGEA
ncbi:MAG TPA: AMP-binding protein, partial [Candidatus Melainabacteria bacterium]|nr:AMP-binding protein [Candidatus Melainabacteria bacterium]